MIRTLKPLKSGQNSVLLTDIFMISLDGFLILLLYFFSYIKHLIYV